MIREDFLAAMSSPEPDERREAVIALAELPPEGADVLVTTGLGDPEWRVRKEAVRVAVALAERFDISARMVDALCQGENVGLRNSALEVLGLLGRPAAETLLEALPKAPVGARKFLVDALGDTGDFRAVPALVEAAGDPEPNLAAAAIDALARIGGPDAEAAMRRRLALPDPYQRMAALDGLDRVAARVPFAELAPALGDRMVRRVAMRVLGRTGAAEALPFLLDGLLDRPPHVIAAAARALVDLYDDSDALAALVTRRARELGEPARSALRLLLAGGDMAARQAASLVLLLAEDEPALGGVMALGADGFLPPQALSALAGWGVRAVGPLVDLARRESGAVRATALEMAADLAADGRAQGRLDEALEDVVRSAIRDALHDRDETVKRAGARSLTWWAGPEDAESLVQIAQSSSEDLAMAAGAALESLAASHPSAVEAALAGVDASSASFAALAPVVAVVGGPGAFELLNAALNSSSPTTRRASVNGLAVLGGTRASELLGYALADEDVDVRTAAARALGHLRDPQGMPLGSDSLLLALAGDSPAVQAAAARALAELGDGRAVEPLRELVRSQDGGVAVAAMESLRMLRDPTLGDLLVEALGHPDEEVVKQALYAIDEADGPRVVGRLRLGLEHPAWHVRVLSAQLLGNRRDEAARRLLEERLERETDPMVRKAIERSLEGGGAD